MTPAPRPDPEPGPVSISVVETENLELIAPLWEALFDHHLSTGAAGIAVIPRKLTWPRRKVHYERLFSGSGEARIWVAMSEGKPVGYAMAYEDDVEDKRALVLETLSVLPEARGFGIGTELLERFDQEASTRGVDVAVVDVMGGNHRPRDLYLARGFAPYSEAWLRSDEPASNTHSAPGRATASIATSTSDSSFTISPGLDDTWNSSGEIAEITLNRYSTWKGSERMAGIDLTDDVSVGDQEKLERLFDQLESTGIWTIKVEIPAAPESGAARDFLQRAGFRLATERLLRS